MMSEISKIKHRKQFLLLTPLCMIYVKKKAGNFTCPQAERVE